MGRSSIKLDFNYTDLELFRCFSYLGFEGISLTNEGKFINPIRRMEQIKITPFATGVKYVKFREAVILIFNSAAHCIYL